MKPRHRDVAWLRQWQTERERVSAVSQFSSFFISLRLWPAPTQHSEPWPSQHLLSLWRPFQSLALAYPDKDAITYLTTTWTNHILETKRYFKTGKQPLNIVSIRLTLAKFVLSETQKAKISSVLEPSPALVCQDTLYCNAFLVCRFYGFIDSNYMFHYSISSLIWTRRRKGMTSFVGHSNG